MRRPRIRRALLRALALWEVEFEEIMFLFWTLLAVGIFAGWLYVMYDLFATGHWGQGLGLLGVGLSPALFAAHLWARGRLEAEREAERKERDRPGG